MANATGSIPTSTLNPSSQSDIIALTLPIATKLTQSNYLVWKSQILPLIHGYNLSRFLDSPPPSPTLPSTAGQVTVNPEYLSWHRQDQLLLGWIRSSLTESIQSQVVSCTSTLDLWSSLQRTFSSTSLARVLDLKRQIQSATKGSSPCSDYLNKIRGIADELAFVGHPYSDSELVSAVLNGLGTDYNPFVASIITAGRHETFTFSEVQGMLLSFENLLRGQNTSSTSLSSFSPPSAFATGSVSPNPRPANRDLPTTRDPLTPDPITLDLVLLLRPALSTQTLSSLLQDPPSPEVLIHALSLPILLLSIPDLWHLLLLSPKALVRFVIGSVMQLTHAGFAIMQMLPELLLLDLHITKLM